MLSILDTLHVTCSWDMQKEGSEDTDSACGEDKKVREEVGNSKACRLVAGAIYVMVTRTSSEVCTHCARQRPQADFCKTSIVKY